MKAEETNAQLQRLLDKVTEWCDKWGFRVNVNKFAIVPVTRKRNVAPANLATESNNLPVLKEYKYLGLTFDSRLTYSQHSQTVAEKVSRRRLNVLRLLSGTLWGAPKKSLLMIYTALIRPVIEYGFEAHLFFTKYVLTSIQRM